MNKRQHPVALLLACLAAWWCVTYTVRALDRDKSMSDYVHDRWESQHGFPGGSVYAIAQTADGYLWIGTEKGLVRYDGFRFRLFDHADSPVVPTGPILDLITDAAGDMWIRPQSLKLLRYHDGIFQDVVASMNKEINGVTAMCRGLDGELLFTLRQKGVFKYGGGKFHKLFDALGLVISMAKTGDGKIWMGRRDAGLYYFSD